MTLDVCSKVRSEIHHRLTHAGVSTYIRSGVQVLE